MGGRRPCSSAAAFPRPRGPSSPRGALGLPAAGRRPGRARGLGFLPAPPGFGATPPGPRPQTRAGPLRGGASAFKSGRRWTPAVERADGVRAERAARRWGTWAGAGERGGRRAKAKHLRGAWPWPRTREGAQRDRRRPGAAGCDPAVVPPGRSELRARRGTAAGPPGLPALLGGGPGSSSPRRAGGNSEVPVWAWDTRRAGGGLARPAVSQQDGRASWGGALQVGDLPACPHARRGGRAFVRGAGQALRLTSRECGVAPAWGARELAR